MPDCPSLVCCIRESFGALGALGTLNALARSSAAAPIARRHAPSRVANIHTAPPPDCDSRGAPVRGACHSTGANVVTALGAADHDGAGLGEWSSQRLRSQCPPATRLKQLHRGRAAGRKPCSLNKSSPASLRVICACTMTPARQMHRRAQGSADWGIVKTVPARALLLAGQ